MLETSPPWAPRTQARSGPPLPIPRRLYEHAAAKGPPPRIRPAGRERSVDLRRTGPRRGGTDPKEAPMRRRLACAAVLLLALPASASADGPQANPGLMEGWTGVTAPGLPFRYVTLPTRSQTVLASVRRSSGRVW